MNSEIQKSLSDLLANMGGTSLEQSLEQAIDVLKNSDPQALINQINSVYNANKDNLNANNASDEVIENLNAENLSQLLNYLANNKAEVQDKLNNLSDSQQR